MSTALLLLIIAACHLGRPPLDGPGAVVSVGRIQAPVAEPGLEDALRQGLAVALADRSQLAGPGEGVLPVEVDVLSATTEVVAIDGDRRVHRARLVVEGRLLGPRPTALVLRGERSYEVEATDGLGAAQARALAFQQLSTELTADLAAWLQHAPAARPDPAAP